MALSKAEGPFDMLTALSKAERLRFASSFVTAAFFVRLIPQDLRACIWIFFLCRLISTFYNDVKS
jgi:hypothetical protein